MTKSPLVLADKKEMHIHVYSDQSSIELFTDDYATSHSCNIFADENQTQNAIAAYHGKLNVKKIQTWELKN